MMLKMEHYEKGHRIASLAKSSETAEKMLGEGYQTALLQGQKLIFYPMDVENKEAWSIELTEEEARAAQETGEYSILEFQDHAAYVYYDACAVDNALFITNRCNSNCIMCPVSSIVRKNS